MAKCDQRISIISSFPKKPSDNSFPLRIYFGQQAIIFKTSPLTDSTSPRVVYFITKYLIT